MKPLKAPNTFGSVYKLQGRRRKPWVARITTGWTTATAQKGKRAGEEVARQLYQTVGYFETKQEALDALILHRVSPVAPKAEITLGELYEEWSQRHYQNIGRATQDNYRAAWKFIKQHEHDRFKDLRTGHWQTVVDRLAAEGKSRSTLKKVKTLSTLLYGYALQNDVTAKAYGEYIRLPKEAKHKKDIFSDLEIKKMFEQADAVPYVDTILIMIYSGLRISELLSLTRFNVDLKARLLTGGLKTDAGKDRVIPIHPKVYPCIKRWHARGGNTLICRENGTGFTATYYRKSCYYPALEKLQIRRLTPHACRHTFASLMAKAGADPLYTQRIIGHADYAFTADNYTHPEIKELRRAIGKI